MTEPYLIAHLVRGEPAFDIAERMEVVIGEDEWGKTLVETFWIIPTSGHRAYPYWKLPLSAFDFSSFAEIGIPDPTWIMANPPSDWPDHYAPSAAPKGQGLIKNLAERLGFVPKPPTITRR